MDRAKDTTPDWSERAGADFLQLDPAHAPPGGLSHWIAESVRTAIGDGRLPLGSRLPPGRRLAAELGVARGTVTEAYRRLAEDGHVAGRGRAGTVVVAAPAAAPAPPAAGTARAPADPFTGAPGPEVFDALRAAQAPIDLTPGVPDLAAFPRAAWLRAERAVLAQASPGLLGYGDPRGAAPLRTAAAAWLARNRGIRADPGRLVVVAGTAQALGLVARILAAERVGAVAVEDPGSLGVRQHLAHWGMDTPPVPVDPDGVRVSDLHDSGAGAALLTPAHQYPTGAVLAPHRRRALIEWARGTGGLVIEDDYDAEHRYDRPPVPALRAMLPDHVFYTGSVSKLLAPALRLGWALAPERHHGALVEAKRFADLGSAVLPQLVLARLMESGELERHLRLLRRRHRRRRDALIAALAQHLPRARVHGAAAGLHLTVTFPGDSGALDDTALARAALREGAKAHPLSWHRVRPGEPGLVLGYAATPAGRMDEAADMLARALARAG
ncbi:PLP-dependent aminotransferase family protein [Nocardiopsis sp. RSe5-2]|uniref:PLP-dependent aminotransferase family protein n=1 Tax=Nocardiopsis endophytica TaxID=3018445 RepID=A0ABT4U093_9ACTN|nr:PLP-dependent aminotransferase family protein [Nocardiopsis endophytica]MDA2809787.1 PLP-dependent aminotransferase family protein [Nocardiopsis endophytica]